MVVVSIAHAFAGDTDGAPQAPPASSPAAPIIIREKALLEPPAPTASPTWGIAATFAGDQAIVTGPVMSRVGGFDGQIATFTERSGEWVPHIEMLGVHDLRPMDAGFQRVRGAPGLFVTNLDRKNALRSSVLVFTPDDGSAAGWRQTAVLSTPGGEPSPALGSAMATDGTFVVASDVDIRPRPGRPDEMPRAPGVHVFAKVDAGEWERMTVLRRDAARNSIWFGASLSMDGQRLAIGSPRGTVPFSAEPLRLADDAVVEVRRRDGANWPIEAEIRGAAVTPWIGFGTNVAIGGDILAVRASEIVDGGTGSKVFIFRRVDGTWIPDGELLANGVISSSGFGVSLAVSDGRVLVGDSHATVPGESPFGVVHGFERRADRWVETLRLLPQAPCLQRTFGAAMAVHRNRVIVGRVKSEAAKVPNGGAYIFELPPPTTKP